MLIVYKGTKTHDKLHSIFNDTPINTAHHESSIGAEIRTNHKGYIIVDGTKLHSNKPFSANFHYNYYDVSRIHFKDQVAFINFCNAYLTTYTPTKPIKERTVVLSATVKAMCIIGFTLLSIIILLYWGYLFLFFTGVKLPF